jgi:hypothetical protein
MVMKRFVVLVSSCMLLAHGTPARASSMGPELPVSTPVPEPMSLYTATAASDGAGALVVLHRGQFWGPPTIATRISPTGDVLDPGGFLVTTGAPRALAWTGESYLLLSITRQTGEGFYRMGATAIATNGAVGPTNEIGSVDALASNRGEGSALAAGGGFVFAAWWDGSIVRGAFLDPSTGARTGSIFSLSRSEEGGSPEVAWDGERFAVVYRFQDRLDYPLKVVTIGTDRRVRGPTDIGSGIDANTCFAASHGIGLVSGWHWSVDSTIIATTTRIMFDGSTAPEVLLDAAGRCAPAAGGGWDVIADENPYLDGEQPTTRITHVPTAGPASDVVTIAQPDADIAGSLGADPLVVWRNGDDLAASRLRDGALADDPPVALSMASFAEDQSAPAVITSDGHTTLAVWRRDPDREPSVYASRVPPDGALPDGEGFPLPISPYTYMGAATSRTGTLLAYHDWDCSPDVGGVIVDADGHVGTPFTIGPPACGARVPVASDGTGFVVALARPDGVWTTHVGSDGSVDASTLVLEHASEPALASDGTSYLLVAKQNGPDACVPIVGVCTPVDEEHLVALRLTANGVPLGPPLPLSSRVIAADVRGERTRRMGGVFVASSGLDYLVTWSLCPPYSEFCDKIGVASIPVGGPAVAAHEYEIYAGGHLTSGLTWTGTAYALTEWSISTFDPVIRVLGPAGQLSDPRLFDVHADYLQGIITVARADGGVHVGYARYATEEPYRGRYRAFVRKIEVP